MNNNHSEPEIPSANARANGRPAGPAQPVVVHPPAMRELHLAIVGANHLRDFLQPLGLTAYRLLLAEPDRAQIEIEGMRSRREGGLLIDVGNLNDTGTKLASAHEWFSTPLAEKMMEGQPLPAGIGLKNGHIAFSMSENISLPMIQAAFGTMMKPRCLRTYLSTPAGRERLVVAGHRAGSWFHTGLAHSPTPASAIPLTGMFLLRPRRELPQLVRALSALLATFTATEATKISNLVVGCTGCLSKAYRSTPNYSRCGGLARHRKTGGRWAIRRDEQFPPRKIYFRRPEAVLDANGSSPKTSQNQRTPKFNFLK